jgi:putative membrane protein
MFRRRGAPWEDDGMRFAIRVVITAVALFVATALVPGIELLAGSGWSKAGTLVVVALIFGLVNAVLKPVVKAIGCLFYLLTLGLIAFVVNALLLWLTSWVAGQLSLPFHITGFWPAFWGAIIVAVVGWVLNVALDQDRRRRRRSKQHFSAPPQR